MKSDGMLAVLDRWGRATLPGAVLLFFVLLTLAPLLYAISSGPAMLLVKEGVISGGTWERIYDPLLYVAYPNPVLKAWLELFA